MNKEEVVSACSEIFNNYKTLESNPANFEDLILKYAFTKCTDIT
jgi:hypothetical protein